MEVGKEKRSQRREAEDTGFGTARRGFQKWLHSGRCVRGGWKGNAGVMEFLFAS